MGAVLGLVCVGCDGFRASGKAGVWGILAWSVWVVMALGHREGWGVGHVLIWTVLVVMALGQAGRGGWEIGLAGYARRP